MECPHTASPPRHEVDYRASLRDPQGCGECHLLVRHCAQCGGINRIQARYCTVCAAGLGREASAAHRLRTPGELRKALKDPPKFPLRTCLELAPGYEPYTWYNSVHGAFVLTREPQSRDTPLGLHWIPSHRFEPRHGRKVAADLPPPGRWVRAPMASVAGFFIACPDRLHFFPAHGYADPFCHRTWGVGRGERIVAMTVDGDGEPVLLVETRDARLMLYFGSCQLGEGGGAVKLWNQLNPWGERLNRKMQCAKTSKKSKIK